MTMLVSASGGESEEGKAMHSHLSSNYTTTLIPLGLELIARVQTPAAPVTAAAAEPLLPPAPAR